MFYERYYTTCRSVLLDCSMRCVCYYLFYERYVLPPVFHERCMLLPVLGEVCAVTSVLSEVCAVTCVL